MFRFKRIFKVRLHGYILLEHDISKEQFKFYFSDEKELEEKIKHLYYKHQIINMFFVLKEIVVCNSLSPIGKKLIRNNFEKVINKYIMEERESIDLYIENEKLYECNNKSFDCGGNTDRKCLALKYTFKKSS